ncbi:recyclin-1 [[Candida] railenensis]|uniref:Recyclin-1 n=1 Tax=[Candida] railenensis TaxID=45579 RepID=A0A9P0QMC7_9ASCO|nr:recyclin-1 [[Candida] railenensis]
MSQVIWNADIDVYNPQVIPLSVARSIAKCLDIQDLIAFSQVSKNTYKAVKDPHLWISKLKLMSVWDTAFIPEKGSPFNAKQFLSENFHNSLTCFDTIAKSPKLAQMQVILIHKCLQSYYIDLRSNKPYEKLKIFKDFTTPIEQAKIFQNLLNFNNIDLDNESHELIRDKIMSILEMFENALLRELEIHFDIEDYSKTKEFVSILLSLGNEQTVIDFFLQKTIFDNEQESEVFNVQLFDHESFFHDDTADDGTTVIWKLNLQAFENFTLDLAKTFNNEAAIIDLVFPEDTPMMYKVSEELISNQLMELIMILISTSKKKGCYLILVPTLYNYLINNFVSKLKPSSNVGESYLQLVRELIDMSYESFAVEYVREEGQTFKSFTTSVIQRWQNSINEREQQTVQNILKNVRVENKNDFLSSFKKVFTIGVGNTSGSNTGDESGNNGEEDENYSEIVAKTKILAENIKSLNKIFSIETSMEILNEAKICLHRLSSFKEFSIAGIRAEIYSGMQDIFISLIESVGNEHVKLGFEKALEYLNTYKPRDLRDIATAEAAVGTTSVAGSNSESALTDQDPLVLFSELINMADLIIQMIDIFYKEEFINTNIVKIENSILNPSLQHKKKFEGIVDTYVADGLNIGIDLLMDQVENIFNVYLSDEDYNPSSSSTVVIGPTDAAQRVIRVLDENIDLLVGCTDKSIVEVFQKEISERFFQLIVKTLKKSTISVNGAMNLISDLNLYHDFIVEHIRSNKKLVIPLYQALKKVGSIYLISGQDSKAIGKLVSDLSKFNGIFGQEEIYEFVQRRQDWLLIKRHVEKVIYGLSLVDCSIV